MAQSQRKIDTVINSWTARLLANESHYSQFDGTIKFAITGSQGGNWIFICRPPVAVIESDEPAQCTITMNDLDFLEMSNTGRNPQEFFASGKLTVTGDTLLGLRATEIIEGIIERIV